MTSDPHPNAYAQSHMCDETCQRIQELKASGLTAVEIAKEVEMSPQWARARLRMHQGIAPKVYMRPQREHSCDYRCAQILKFRAGGMTYSEMANKMNLTKARIGQIVIGHNYAIKKAGGRSGPSYCITCQRKIGSTMPETTLLPKDEACGWCCRRWDGDVRLVTPVLLEMARKLGTQDKHVAMQGLHKWREKERRNSAETRERQYGTPDATEFEYGTDERAEG